MILSVCPNPSIDTYAWLDHFEPGKVNRIKKTKEFPGGKGIHVAMAIAELDGDSTLMANWAGNSGAWIKSACKKRGVKITGVELAESNRKCYTFRSENTHFANSELLEPGPLMNDENWQDFITTYKKELSKASLACLSGSWPKGSPANAYYQLIITANEKKVKTILDCSGQQLKEALKTDFFGLHLNEDEAKKLCGSTNITVLLEKLKRKVELVALTKGKKGLELFYKGKIISANVKLNNIISTVGSGDCLTAGIAFAVVKGLGINEIARYGIACGAANCLTENLGILQKENVERLLRKVELNIVENAC